MLLLGIAALVACGGIMMGWAEAAHATNSDEAAKVVKERAEREFDRMTQPGTADKIEGQTQETLGKAQRELGDDVEGTAKQVQGKVQKNVGRTKQAADEAEDSAENLVDKAKDFFN